MLFMRTYDDVEITTKDNKIISYSTHKRKGQKVLKFIINNEEQDNEKKISFFEDELICKMIPKKSLNILKTHPIKFITTDSGNIFAFQDIECKVHFLTINSIDGKIEKTTFDELDINDSIICYDNETGDWYLDDIDEFYIFYDTEYLEEDTDELEVDMPDDEIIVNLSNYIINSENGGIICNRILVI